MAFITAAIISGGAALIGGKMQANAANRSARMQQNQAARTRADLMPYMEAGGRGIDPLLSELGLGGGGYDPRTYDYSMDGLSAGFQNSPGYQYQMDEMSRAVQNSAAARGQLGSGATLKALQRNAQGLASQDYWNFYNSNRQSVMDRQNSDQTRVNNLQNLAATGANAASQSGQFGQNAAANAGNMMTKSAAASASGLTGAANAFQSMAGNQKYFDIMTQMANRPG
jgi:hypothetical protein